MNKFLLSIFRFSGELKIGWENQASIFECAFRAFVPLYPKNEKMILDVPPVTRILQKEAPWKKGRATKEMSTSVHTSTCDVGMN